MELRSSLALPSRVHLFALEDFRPLPSFFSIPPPRYISSLPRGSQVLLFDFFPRASLRNADILQVTLAYKYIRFRRD